MTLSMMLAIFSFLREAIIGTESDRRKLTLLQRLKKWVFLIVFFLSVLLNYYALDKNVFLTAAYIKAETERKKLATDQLEERLCKNSLDNTKKLLELCVTSRNR